MLGFNIKYCRKFNKQNLISVFNIRFTSSKTVSDFASKYISKSVESNKYEKWQNSLATSISRDDREKFKIIVPPPNITGTLHLGHALTFTIQDVLVRWNKMRGMETVWIPGMDHAGIATQVVVEKKLWKEQKKTRHDIGREQFVKEIWKWKEQKSDVIREQIKRIGALPDWSKEIFTMDMKQSKAVTEAFIRLFESGLIYRSDRLVNWSCILQSAISDIEVEYVEIAGRTKLTVPGYEKPVEFGNLTKFAYKLCEIDEEVMVCTTRPETIPGDVAVAVHPTDERYKHLHGMHVQHPFRNERIPIICDNFVDPEFGTGAVKITPGHDPVDFEVGKRHSLKILQVINETGTMVSSNLFDGLKRFDARLAVIHKLEDLKLLRSIEDHSMTVPLCSRSKDVIEYLIKPQWFIDCQKMAERACQDVREGRLKIEPPSFEKVWFSWLENIRDWCISRQLWWGHRIPIYECRSKTNKQTAWVAAQDEENARQKAAIKFKDIPDNIDLTQDNDVLDTWFSSALLPFSSFGWPENTEDLKKYYPLTLMETGHDILFFWVARMVMLGTELTGRLPFDKILLHGIICDANGRKMSKSLGNVVNPEDVITGISLQDLANQARKAHDSGLLSVEELERSVAGQKKMFPDGIPECGADALRFTLCSHNIKNHFINFDISECNTNKLFCNKIWQACRYTYLCMEKLSTSTQLKDYRLSMMDKWILSRLSKMIKDVNEGMISGDFHLATFALKQFLYSDFCDVYVEATKPAFKNLDITKAAGHLATLILCMERGLRCISPFMPFLAEELYNHLPCHPVIEQKSSVTSTVFPQDCEWHNKDIEKDVDIGLEAVRTIRRLVNTLNITNTKDIKGYIVSHVDVFHQLVEVIQTLTNCGKISVVLESQLPSSTASDTIGSYGVVHLQIPETNRDIDSEQILLAKKINKLMEKISKMEKTFSHESYKLKAPPNVQKNHAEQLCSLNQELVKLRKFEEMLKQQ